MTQKSRFETAWRKCWGSARCRLLRTPQMRHLRDSSERSFMRITFPWPRVMLIGVLWAWCVFLIILRARVTPQPFSANLMWNLVLATVPLLCSGMAQWAARSRHRWLTGPALVVWLLFLPNAPYILTDFFHLQAPTRVPIWLDVAMVLGFAGAGLLFCYLSLSEVQSLVQRKYGASIGWLASSAVLLLCGFGIYLGRYLRLNSWYVITHPGHVFHKSLYRIGVDQTLPSVTEVTLVYGVGLMVGYLALHLVIAATADRSKTF